MVVGALVGVRKVLELDGLELLVLFDESEDENRRVVERVTVCTGPCGDKLQMTTCQSLGRLDYSKEEQTWMTTFPGASITS